MNKLKPILSARKDCTISYTIVILAFILIQTMIATGNITSSLKDSWFRSVPTSSWRSP